MGDKERLVALHKIAPTDSMVGQLRSISSEEGTRTFTLLKGVVDSTDDIFSSGDISSLVAVGPVGRQGEEANHDETAVIVEKINDSAAMVGLEIRNGKPTTDVLRGLVESSLSMAGVQIGWLATNGSPSVTTEMAEQAGFEDTPFDGVLKYYVDQMAA
jgi:hypothetical protein